MKFVVIIIRKIIVYVCRWLGFIVSFVFKYKYKVVFSYLFNNIYSSWIKCEFKNVGKNLFVSTPIYLYGGKNITIGDNFYSLKRIEN